MSLTAFRTAQKVCSLSDWSLTNLQLQKILYLSHLLYFGQRKEPLILERFQAWTYGPVLPGVYNRVKVFQDRPILNVFYGSHVLREDDPIDGDKACFLRETYQKLARRSARELVRMTHLRDGAWEKAFQRQPYSTLQDDDILSEYEEYYRDEEI